MNIATILQCPDKTKIPEFEGIVTSIKAVGEKQRGVHEKYGPWIFQDTVLKDSNGDEIKVQFSHPDVEQELSIKGKKVRLSCSDGSHGLSGVTIETGREYKGEAPRFIKVTASANVQLVGPGGVPSASPSAPSPKPQHQAQPSSQATGDTVENRASAYFDIMKEVVKYIEGNNPLGADKGAPLGGFSPSDIKEITTGISMSFKGQYGVYAPPVFGKPTALNQPAQPAQSTEDEIPMSHPGDSERNAQPDWKSVLHAKRNKTLGQISEGPGGAHELAVLAGWALTVPEPKNEKAKDLYDGLHLMLDPLKKKGSPANHTLQRMISLDPRFKDMKITLEGVETVLGNISDLSEDECIDHIKAFEKLFEQIAEASIPELDSDDMPE